MRRSLTALCSLLLVLQMAGCSGAPWRQSPAPAPPAQPPAPVLPSQPAPVAVLPSEPAPVAVRLEPARVPQGGVAILSLSRPVEGPVSLQVDGLWEQPRLVLQEGRPVAFIGIPAAAATGSYAIRLTWAGGVWSGSLAVTREQFTEDRLVVTAEQEETYYDPRSDAEWERVFALRSRGRTTPLWTGPFAPPLTGSVAITTQFGEIRYVNGKETGRHSGVDFGADAGTPVHASAAGRVILAEKLILSGNTVIIDHGANLFTAYYHMDKLAVRPGDAAEQGTVLGTVGNTGFSTGPHLHWTATIGNTPVDPWLFTGAAPLGYQRPGAPGPSAGTE